MSFVLPPCAQYTCRGCTHQLNGQCFAKNTCCDLCAWGHEPGAPKRLKTRPRAYRDCAERIAGAASAHSLVQAFELLGGDAAELCFKGKA
jgi:hypothetical protein